jgi:hypothetical protein
VARGGFLWQEHKATAVVEALNIAVTAPEPAPALKQSAEDRCAHAARSRV